MRFLDKKMHFKWTPLHEKYISIKPGGSI